MLDLIQNVEQLLLHRGDAAATLAERVEIVEDGLIVESLLVLEALEQGGEVVNLRKGFVVVDGVAQELDQVEDVLAMPDEVEPLSAALTTQCLQSGNPPLIHGDLNLEFADVVLPELVLLFEEGQVVGQFHAFVLHPMQIGLGCIDLVIEMSESVVVGLNNLVELLLGAVAKRIEERQPVINDLRK